MADYEVGGIATVKAKITGVFDDAGRIELTVGDDIFGIHQSHIFSYKPPSLAQRLAGLTVEQIDTGAAEHTAKMAAKQGRGSLDKYLAALDDDGREDARSFMPELLGIADAADDDAKDAKAANERAREVDDLPM